MSIGGFTSLMLYLRGAIAGGHIPRDSIGIFMREAKEDYDALLALRSTLTKIANEEGRLPEVTMGDDAFVWTKAFWRCTKWAKDALAALPEHLKGDTNERSRKA